MLDYYIIGSVLIILGVIHIVLPKKACALHMKMLSYSSFYRPDSKPPRLGFIVAFGVVWILVGLNLIVFGT